MLIRHGCLVCGAKVWYFSEFVISLEKAHDRRSREAIRSDDAVVSAAEVRELKKRIRELERAAQLVMEPEQKSSIIKSIVTPRNVFKPFLTLPGSFTKT